MGAIQLREHQMKALKKIHNGCILCGQVGSGKSITGLAYYYTQCGGTLDPFDVMTRPKDLYIITTAKKRDSCEWDKELARFILSRHKEAMPYDITVVVESWNNIKKYVGVENAFFLFDEDKVTGTGAWVKAFYKISKKNQWIILSATPGDNYSDYAPVFIANGFYRNITEFRNQHVTFKPYTNWPQIDHDKYRGIERLERLRRRVLVDMPFKREVRYHDDYIYAGYDKDLYKTFIKTRWNPFEDKPIENASQFCYCLRKIVNLSQERQTLLLEVLEKNPKAIIFYNFMDELEVIKQICDAAGIEYAQWNGVAHESVPEGERWVYLCQYNAAAEAWECTRTNCIIFYSQTYSYKTLTQAKGRIDRLNTPYSDLYYYHFLSRSGIDLAIKQALNKKKKFNESAFFEGKFG